MYVGGTPGRIVAAVKECLCEIWWLKNGRGLEDSWCFGRKDGDGKQKGGSVEKGARLLGGCFLKQGSERQRAAGVSVDPRKEEGYERRDELSVLLLFGLPATLLAQA